MPDDNSAASTGATFEENKSTPKIIINDKPRATEPEYTGSEAVGEVDEQPAATKKRPPSASSKSSTLKPDVAKQDIEPAESEALDSDDGAAIDELAKAASDKKTPKESADDDKIIEGKIQSLVENKTYFVPIGQATKRRNAKIILVILVLLIVAGIASFVLMSGANQ